MAINVSQPFHRTSAGPIDDSLNLSKAQMLAVNDNLMPSKWFTVCADDGQFYLYDKSNEPDEETGKFRLYQSGKTYSSGDGVDVDNENDEISVDEMPAEDMDEIVTPLPSIKKPYEVYSTKEQRIGFWVDGKPLYQKTIDIGDLTLNTAANVGVFQNYSNASMPIIETLVNQENIIIWPNGSSRPFTAFTMDGNNSTSYINAYYDISNSRMNVCTGADRSTLKLMSTLTYTKTTDTPEPMYISIPVD